MLAGAYPSDEFAELKPRVVWDRVTDIVEGRRDARVVAVTSGGTIPDRGLFGVFLAGEAGTPGRRVGELDEEMVYELRAGMHGDVIVLGASSWRVQDITPRPGHRRRRRRACRASCRSGRATPSAGRSSWVGRSGRSSARSKATSQRGAAGRARRVATAQATSTTSTIAPPRTWSPTSRRSARSTGALPTDRRIVVERFRDELGDWRLVLLTPFGGRVHAPWALAIEARLARAARHRGPDDLVGRRHRDPPARGRGRASMASRTLLFPAPEEVEDLVVGRSAVPRCSRAGSARTRPGRCSCRAAGPARGPRSGSSASGRPTCSPSPAATAASRSSSRRTASACRTCSTSTRCARSSAASSARDRRSTASRRHGPRRSRARSCSTTSPRTCTRATRRSPSDAPAPWRSTATSCASCSGQEELRELLDPEALADLELSLQALSDDRQATTRRPGPRPAAAARRPVDRGGRPRASSRAEPTRRRMAARAGRRPARGQGPDRRRGALDRDRGRGALPRRRRRRGRRSACPRRSSHRRPARSMGCSRAGRGPTGRS